MATLTKIIPRENIYLPQKCRFKGYQVPNRLLDKVFDFTYEMVLGTGYHRKHRSGGIKQRTYGELFANTFQGKLAEFIIYNILKKWELDCLPPDTTIWGKGKWDTSDLVCNQKHLNIKSVAFFSNLLLLETKDWDSSGNYLPNLKEKETSYSFFIIVRLKPDLKQLLRRKRLFYQQVFPREELATLLKKQTWFFDVPGVVSKIQLIEAINQNHMLPQGAFLGSPKTPLDASNYYIQLIDAFPLQTLKKLLKEIP